ncbi:LTA synthase family protein [Halomonas organivorans]|uniref:Phosphoglycerol transferase MdoB-like AlkP superfamily enzyme n=1 Tax=Halomonas organivorans TaxID=257772 RepID=A0A7W5C2K0_9GAMM|nr:LTA synthase family protein [Halomonas organivorans]MBB3143482.1 phosphoglycerol transferase MdoB-like AlkP superfamily enzyme [Halomonas organivorans]
MPTTRCHRPQLFLTWLRFLVVLTLVTWGLRLISAMVLTPSGLWPTAWWWGLRFDLAISALLAGLTILALWPASRLFQRLPRRGWLVPAAAILLFAQLGDWLYWRETGRHVGYEAAELVNSAGSLGGMLFARWPYLAGILALLVLIGRIPVASARRQLRLAPELAMLAVIVATVPIVRGGVNGVPQSPDDAQRLGEADAATAALNGAYAALHGLQRGHKYALERTTLGWMSDTEAKARVDRLYPDRRLTTGAPREMNVAVVLLESWASVFMEPLDDGRAVTPRFDALAEQSLHSHDLIAGGRRTTEGMFSLFCSYQNPPGQTIAQTDLARYDYDCLPSRLAHAGWQTAFFQGSHENTSGTGAFAQSLGFRDSFGKEDIERHTLPENYWGVYDRDLYRFALDRMSDMQEPMLIGINTNTTHDTQVPPGITPLIDSDSRAAGIRNTLHMADESVGNFVDAIESRDWQHPWLIVLVADHTSRVEGTILERSRLPFLLYAPGIVKPGRLPRTGHQRDVSPTLADIMNMPLPAAMGHSLLDPDAPQLAEYHQAGTLGWVMGDQVVEFSLLDPTQRRCFAWQPPASPGAEQPCDERAAQGVRNAYALTQQAQRHLFDGTTSAFAREARHQDAPSSLASGAEP